MNAVLQILGLFFTAGLWQLALELGALLLLPALGGTISERSGVVNIAMEGMMLTGAFTAVVTDLVWHNALLATLAAAISGGLMALIHAVVSIRFRADQIISGFAINIFAFGLTTFLIDKMTNFQGAAHVPQAYTLPVITVPVLSNIPFLGQVLFQQNIMVYVALALLVGMNIMLFRTRLGLRIRAVGEHPQAADTAGINVYTLRYGAVIASGLLSGLGGAFLSIGINNVFLPNMTDGAGYIALAAMIFGKWKPFGAFVACMIFGIGEAIYANNSTIHISQYLLNTLPYILTIVVLAAFVGKSAAPAADGLPYEPGVE
ncbi:MAG: ABC transporter, permease protein 2 [Ktedonobacterales bacterium]|jgi:simple sugar transport system permease protein|nr:MAG: ABC transporter, permease protein 2 [Ktedonobacterales bacterium]